jgi:DNA-binding LytR/AlgR family response regulator
VDVLENELTPQQFSRVSRRFFINIHAIKDIITYSNSRLKIIISNYREQEIIVSRERVKDFKEWLE